MPALNNHIKRAYFRVYTRNSYSAFHNFNTIFAWGPTNVFDLTGAPVPV